MFALAGVITDALTIGGVDVGKVPDVLAYFGTAAFTNQGSNPMNILTDILPANIRKYLYAAFALAGIVTGALAVAGVDVGKTPDVLAYLGIAFGFTAASNTTDTAIE